MIHGAAFSAAAERNQGPILEVLRPFLPARGLVLEVASGTGQHVVHFAEALPTLQWQPSESDAEMRRSIALRLEQAKVPNVRPPIELDVRALPWPVAAADALVCINMIHIAAWSATQALIEGANGMLPEGGLLYLYGPYRRLGRPTAPSNEAFDAGLRARNPEWGLRILEEVVALARGGGFELADVIEMPANNLSVVLRKANT